MKQRKQIWLILKLSLFLSRIICQFSCTAIAQTSPKGATITSTTDSGKTGNTWAVIAGISKYQNVQGLNYADKDAMAINISVKIVKQENQCHRGIMDNVKV